MTPRTGLRSYRGSWTKNGSSGWKWDTFRAAFRLAVAASVFSRSDPSSSAASSPCLPLFTASSFFFFLLFLFSFIFVAVNSTLGHWFIGGRVSATMQGVGRQCKKNKSLDSCRFVRMLTTSDPQAAAENAAAAAGSVSDHVDRQRREANARSLALSSDSSHYLCSVNCGDLLSLSCFSEFLWQGCVAFCPPYKVIRVGVIDYCQKVWMWVRLLPCPLQVALTTGFEVMVGRLTGGSRICCQVTQTFQVSLCQCLDRCR